MADDNDVERSYPATPRRLEQAREHGRVARSRELATAAVVLAAALSLWGVGPVLFQRCLMLFRGGLTLEHGAAFSDERMLSGLGTLASDMLVALAPLLGIVLVVTILAPLLLSGWVFSLRALKPDFTRLDPMRGFGNLVSGHSLGELVKALAKSALLGGIGAWAVWHHWGDLQQLATQDPRVAVSSVAGLVTTGFFALTGGLVLIALIDVPWQLWHYHDSLKMTREEVRQEQREMEGDPQLKARIRSQQRAMARKRMMAAVPTADVIVTNPTHYAVALQYRENSMRAPRVVAKGAELVAQRIREIGDEHRIPIVEAPPLARALYRHAEIGSEVPAALYTAIAQVLAYVYLVQRHRSTGGAPPPAPADLSVPPELDPLAATEGASAGADL